MMKLSILLAVVTLCSALPDSNVPTCKPTELEVAMENEPVFKQCNGILRNWLQAKWNLTDDQVRAVGAKKIGNEIGSQLLVQVSPQVCMVTPIFNPPRGPPTLGNLCKFEGSCLIPPTYSKC